jgi:hypothetical protein
MDPVRSPLVKGPGSPPAGPAFLATFVAVAATWSAASRAQETGAGTWPADSLVAPMDSLAAVAPAMPPGNAGWMGALSVVAATLVLVLLFHRRSS